MKYESGADGELLIGGVPTILANGPVSPSAPIAEPVEAASLSSPVTKLLNAPQTEPETLPMLGFEIHEDDPSLGACRKRFPSSSSVAQNVWW